jgi:hypothetical protein
MGVVGESVKVNDMPDELIAGALLNAPMAPMLEHLYHPSVPPELHAVAVQSSELGHDGKSRA